MNITVKGRASGKSTYLTIDDKIDDNQDATANCETLLEFLTKKGFPIASSCSGNGVCLKCMTSDGQITCQILLKNITNEEIFSFNYL